MSLERLIGIGARVSAIGRMLLRAPSCGAVPAALAYVTIDPAQALADICAHALSSGPGAVGEMALDTPDISGSIPDEVSEAQQRRPVLESRWPSTGQTPRNSPPYPTTVGREISTNQALASVERRSAGLPQQDNPTVGAVKIGGARSPVTEATSSGFSLRHAGNLPVAAPKNTVNMQEPTGAALSRRSSNDTATGPSRVTPVASSAEIGQARSRINLEEASEYAARDKPALRNGHLVPHSLERGTPRDDARLSAASLSSTPVRWVRGPQAITRVLGANLATAQSVPYNPTAAKDGATRMDSSLADAGSPPVEAQRLQQSAQLDVEFLLEELEHRLRLEYQRTYGTSGGL